MMPSHASVKHPSRGPRDSRRRRWAIFAWIMAGLSALLWLVCGVSYVVQWSRLSPGPVRAIAPAVGSAVIPATGFTTIEERDETHLMFGQGGLFLKRFTTYTQSFASPNADANSRGLAWATLDDTFPPFLPFRFRQTAAGPLWGVRLWALAAVPTCLLILSLLVRKRIAPDGICPTCRYVLAGLSAGATCPECGSKSTRSIESLDASTTS